MAQLKARRVKKTYLALVQGSVAAAVGRIEAPIGRDPKHRTRMAVVPDGRPSVTGYRVRERFDGWTLLELDLVTGRTHQIRVHLDAIGHPVAGDPVYGTGTSRRGPDGLDRLFLHAWRLELNVAVRRAPDPGDGAAAGRAGARPRARCASPSVDRHRTASRGRPTMATPPSGAMLVIISGPSGVGKDTIIDALRRRPRDPDYHYVVTCTTRAARPGEVDGVDYHFLDRGRRSSRSASSRRVPRGQRGPRQLVRHAARRRSARRWRRAATSSSRSTSRAPRWSRSRSRTRCSSSWCRRRSRTLFQRLRARATETADQLELRQRNAAIELARQEDYDYVVTNETGQVERTAERIDEIIADEHRRHPDRPVGSTRCRPDRS